MSSNSNIIHLPLITIQHDLSEVIEDIRNGSISAEDIWISCYSKSFNSSSTNQSVHGKVRVTSHTLQNYEQDKGHDIGLDQLPYLEARDGIQCHWANHSTYSQLALIVSCETLSIPPTLVNFPFKTMKGVQPKGIECMDVTGEWIVTGGKNGNLRLDSWKTFEKNSNQYRMGRGHLSDITSCQFFPSGEVILSTSIDMSARIYSIHPDPQHSTTPCLMLNPRTFTVPHGGSITAASIIERGKEIITACKDGKIRIWNVSESKVIIEDIVVPNDSIQILCMKIATQRFLNNLGEEIITSNHQLKKGINNQFLVIGLSSGRLHLAHIPSLKPVKYLSSTTHQLPNSAIDALAISDSGELIAYATRSGTVTICTLNWQMISSSEKEEEEQEEEETLNELVSLETFTSWTRTESSVNSLEFSKDGNELLVASDDGLPYRISINSSKPIVIEEYAGFNCDPIQSIRIEPHSQNIFLAGKDGSILIYK